MKRIAFLCLLWLVPLSVWSQEFDFTLRGGMSFCQIDGDQSGGYSKMGYSLSLGTSYPLGRNGLLWGMEIGLTEKGSYVKSIDRSIALHYVEVPLFLAYDMFDKRLRIGAGVAPAILFHARVTTTGVEDNALESTFQKIDPLPLLISARWLFGKRWGLDVRYTTSLIHMDKESGSGVARFFRSNKGLFNTVLAAGLTYTI